MEIFLDLKDIIAIVLIVFIGIIIRIINLIEQFKNK